MRGLLLLALSGCCLPPAPPAPATPRASLPGVVVIVDSRGWAVCTGAAIAPSLVLTARHCTWDVKGVTVPREGDHVTGLRTPFAMAKPLEIPVRHRYAEGPGSVRGMDWDPDDWALLEVDGTFQTLPLYDGDPIWDIPRGARVSMPSYVDREHIADKKLYLRPHEHVFTWGDPAEELAQGGHSGAPLLWEGKIVGIFSGQSHLSRGGERVCGGRPTLVRFVSSRTIREGL
jgi:hypothetical protein